MRTINLIFLLILPVQAAASSEGIGDIVSIVEVIGSIINAAKALEGIYLFLVLIATIGIIAVVLHLWHKRVAVTLTLFALLIFAVAVTAYRTHDAREDIQSVAQSRLFLPLGESRQLGSFIITLTDVDTLKTKIKEGEPTPWVFNLKFGNDALKDFVELGRIRMKKDFIMDAEILNLWPMFDEIVTMPSGGEPSHAWQSMMQRLEVEVVNSKTRRKVLLKDAFSKWPVVNLTIRNALTEKILVNRYFPDRSVIIFHDEEGTTHQLEIETVFNGDRDIGEAEACVLRFQKVSKSR